MIDVDSIDDTLKKVTSAGGQVVTERMAVGDMGFTGYFTDTEGNLIGLLETPPKPNQPAAHVPRRAGPVVEEGRQAGLETTATGPTDPVVEVRGASATSLETPGPRGGWGS